MKKILYLRTDICDEELISGGSVAHTLGVIYGFQQIGYQVICASSSMNAILNKVCKENIQLKNPNFIKYLRWKINCLLSSFFFAKKVIFELENEKFEFIYQRYSLMNLSGILLAWWYKKKLVLEYNGSEYWIVTNWSSKKRWMRFEWLMKTLEKVTVRNSDMIVVVSQVLQEELLAYGVKPHKILINLNGVDPYKFKK